VLIEMEEQVIVVLVSLLENEPKYRVFALWALAWIGSSTSAPAIRAWLKDDDTLTRALAATALWNCHGDVQRVVDSLIQILEDCNTNGPALREFDACPLSETLECLWFLTPHEGDDKSQLWRVFVHVALREMGAAAIEPLVAALNRVPARIGDDLLLILAAIDRDDVSRPLTKAGNAVQYDLDTRRSVSVASALSEELRRDARVIELKLMSLPLPLARPLSKIFTRNQHNIDRAMALLIAGLEPEPSDGPAGVSE